jgi:hypothetical protein
MFSYFTELNRKRPPAGKLDFVVNTTCPLVHAADDRHAMENLEALPHTLESARAFIGGKPYHVGPSSIGARDNPYGAAPTPNPAGGRVALAYMDPRQRGLFAAAWNLGYLAHMARGKVDAVALSAPVGEFGVIYSPTDYAQPWFDQQGHGVYPVYHVLRGMAAAAGATQLATSLSDGSAVQAVAYRGGGSTVLWLANLSGADKVVELEGLPGGRARIARLDQDGFLGATSGPDGLADSDPASKPDRLELAPYAVLRITMPA